MFKHQKKLNVRLLLVKSAPFIKKSPKEQVKQQKLTDLSFDNIAELPIRDVAKDALTELVQKMSNKINFSVIEVVNDTTDFKNMEFPNTDCLLAMVIDGECQRVIAKFKDIKGVPILLFGASFPPVHTLVAAFGTLEGDNFNISFDAEDATSFLNIRYALKNIRNAKIVMFGGTSTSIIDNQTNAKELKDLYGVEIIQYPPAKLAERARNFDMEKVNCRAGDLTGGATEIQHLEDIDFIQASQLSLAMQEVAKEENATAVTVECAEMYETFGAVPCVPLHDLDDMGITTACEGDVHCLLMKMALQYLSDMPSFMGNLGPFDKQQNTFCVWHHSAPTVFFKDEKYSLETYGHRGVYFVSETKAGSKVTVAKLSPDAKKATVIKGEIASSSDFGNCVGMNIKMNELPKFMKQYLWGNHHVVAMGDHADELAEILKLLKIDITVL